MFYYLNTLLLVLNVFSKSDLLIIEDKNTKKVKPYDSYIVDVFDRDCSMYMNFK